MNQTLKNTSSRLNMLVQYVRREEKLKQELLELSSGNTNYTKKYKLFIINNIEDCIKKRDELIYEILTIIKQCHE